VKTNLKQPAETDPGTERRRTRATPPVVKRIIRMTELTQSVGISRAWIYKLIHTGAFPRPIRLGPHSIGFLATEVEAWIEQRAAERDRVA
jgi:prophage regulatory protein